MIMMMTDPDRVAFVRISACISVSFHSPIHANFKAHLPPECPLQFVTHLITPSDPRLPFHIAAKSVCFLPTSRQQFGHARPSITSHAFSLGLAQHLSASISTSFTKEPTTTQKNLAITSPLPSFFCKPARVHALAFDYLCIYYPWRYLSRTKKKDLLGK